MGVATWLVQARSEVVQITNNSASIDIKSTAAQLLNSLVTMPPNRGGPAGSNLPRLEGPRKRSRYLNTTVIQQLLYMLLRLSHSMAIPRAFIWEHAS